MIIFRFTCKRNGSIETHYVRANTIERASKELSLHLSVPEDTLRHNPKNIPFKVREKILKKVTEVIDGKEVSFALTLDIRDSAQTPSNTSGHQAPSTHMRDGRDSELRTPLRYKDREQAALVHSTTRTEQVQVNKLFDTAQTQYNTYRYDIEHLFKEDEEIIRKYAGDVNLADRTDIIDNTIRKRVYSRLRTLLIRDGHQDKPYKNTNAQEPITLLEILDAYSTNFLNPTLL
jgi:hypothetical protein